MAPLRGLLLLCVEWLARALRGAGEADATRELCETLMRVGRHGIVVADSRGCISVWSSGAAALFELGAGEVVGRPLEELVSERDRQAFRLEVARALMEAGHVRRLQLAGHVGGRGRLELEVSLISWDGARGRELGLALQDITKQVLAQQRLQEAEKNWRDVASNFSDTLLLLDRSGTIMFANRQLADVPVAELIGSSGLELVVPDRPGLLAQGLQHVFETGTAHSYEARRDDRDGHTRWLWCRLAPQTEDGEVVQAVLAITDLTERRARDSAFRRLAAIVEGTTEAVISAGPAGHITTWNHGAERLFGWTEQEAVGRHASFISPPEELARQRQWFERLRDGEQPGRYEAVRVTKDGRRVPVMVAAAALRSSTGEFEGTSAVVRDLSAQRELEAALRRAKDAAETTARLKGEFLANMSHEVRTPLNGIVGMAELLAVTRLDPDQRGYLTTLQEACQGLRIVVDDILDFSKIEAGKLSVENIEYDLPSMAQGVVKMFQPSAELVGTRLSLELPPGLPQRVVGDGNRVRQVLMNLVSNAVKFTRAGTVDVQLSVLGARAGSQRLRAEVRDTGVGMSPETQGNLFQPFSQGDGSNTRRFGGTGLGLAISRQLLTLMGGEVGVKSQLGQGSQFWFELPLVAAAGSGARPARKQSSGPTAEQGGWRILVAEDNFINRQVVSAMLRHLGCEVDLVHDGHEAVAQAQAVQYDAILMDCQMPEMSGFEAAAAIRRQERGGRVPIIAVTAQAYAEDRERCERAGMDDHLAKPITRSELKRVLGEWLKLDTRPPAATAPRRPLAAIDRLALDRLCESLGRGARELLGELVSGFIADFPATVGRLRSALDAGVAHQVFTEAHRLRSSTGNLAAPALSSICQRLELCARTGDLSGGHRLLSELQQEFGGASRALLDYVDRTPQLNSLPIQPISTPELLSS